MKRWMIAAAAALAMAGGPTRGEEADKPALAPAPEADAPKAAEPAAQPLDRLRLKAGALLAGKVLRIEGDAIVMRVFEVERAYKIATIEDMKTQATDPAFLKAVLGEALKTGNGVLAVSVGARDETLTKTILSFPRFLALVEEYQRCDEAVDKLGQPMAQARAQRERAQRQIAVCDKAIAEAQDIVANPYYYETVTQTTTAVCADCGGTGIQRTATSNTVRVIPDRGGQDRGGRGGSVRCPTCGGRGTVANTWTGEVRRMKDVGAAGARILANRAERDRAEKLLAQAEQDLARYENDLKAGRAALANADARLKDICREMWRKFFAGEEKP